MPFKPITNLFNPYDLLTDPDADKKISYQEVVDYCEARFRVVLQNMMSRAATDHEWMLKFLFRELVMAS